MRYPVVGIEVHTIPHEKQRYDTCGDWRFRKVIGEQKEILEVYVSEVIDSHAMHAIAIHEIVEALLCHYAGIEEKDVTAFDIAFEMKRAEGDNSEPGDSPDAPYREQHQAATSIEKLFAMASGLSWSSYQSTVDNLPRHTTLSL